MIGGGSGEHHWHRYQGAGGNGRLLRPALVRRDPLSRAPDEREALRPRSRPQLNASDRRQTRIDWQQVFEFAGWQAADYVDFSARCVAGVPPAVRSRQGRFALEQWLAASVGEFILFAMPELAEEAVQRLVDLRFRHIKGDIYRNILLLPPGYSCWGRREFDNQVTWGISTWRIERVQNPRTDRCN